MNQYTHHFNARCPNNGLSIAYELTIEVEDSRVLMVEDIVQACGSILEGYHEVIADALSGRFGGTQHLRAHHHGVDILTVRKEQPVSIN